MLTKLGVNRNLAVICITIFMNLFARGAWASLLPLYLRSLGANDWQVGISFTLTGLAQTLFGFFGGILADRYGRRTISASTTIAMGVLYLMTWFVHEWYAIVAVLVLINVLGALQWPPLNALIAESSGEGNAARSYSFSEAAVLLGITLGPLFGALVIGIIDIPGLMLLHGVTLLATGLMRWFGLEDHHTHHARRGLPDLRMVFDKNLTWFIIAGACISISFSIPFGPFFSLLANDVWKNSAAEINVLFSIGNVAALGGIFIGRLGGRMDARKVMMLCAGVFGFTCMLWGISPTWQVGLIPLLIAFAFSEGAYIAEQTVQAQITKPETRSSIIGIIITATGIFGGLGPTLGAWLVGIGGDALPFIASGIIALLTIGAATQIKNPVAN